MTNPTTTNFEQIKEFHDTFARTPDPVDVDLGTPEDRLLRARLIWEEYLEVIKELGVIMVFTVEPTDEGTIDISVAPEIDETVISLSPRKLGKELADLKYVVYGTDAKMGIDADRAYAEVHQSNMSKLGPNGEVLRRDDGKVLKGPNYREPSLDWLPEEVAA